MKKEYDFSKGKRVDPSRVDPCPKIMISIRIDAQVLSDIKREAERVGVGYQTLISHVLGRHVGLKAISTEEKILQKILDRLDEIAPPKRKKSKTA